LALYRAAGAEAAALSMLSILAEMTWGLGDLDEALAAACEGLPWVQQAGFTWNALDHLALRTALAGNLAHAARLAGHLDATFVAKETTRQRNEARGRARLQGLLEATFEKPRLECLLTEGATMSESEACRLALEA
jgi:hypothetical protein